MLNITINRGFEERVAEIFLDKCNEYDSLEDALEGYENGEFNPEFGCIPELIYYDDTEKIFKEYFNDIFDIINNYYEEALGEKYDGDLDANSLVWAAFNITVYNWYLELKM